jgi:enolase
VIHAPLIGWRLAQIAPLTVASKDTQAGEVIPGKDRQATISIRVQLEDSGKSKQAVPGGADDSVRRTMLFRIIDAQNQSYTPQDGDLVLQMTDRLGNVVDSDRLYISNPRRVASGIMADTLYRVDLTDRAPARRLA